MAPLARRSRSRITAPLLSARGLRASFLAAGLVVALAPFFGAVAGFATLGGPLVLERSFLRGGFPCLRTPYSAQRARRVPQRRRLCRNWLLCSSSSSFSACSAHDDSSLRSTGKAR